jgi:DNA-directed RNA polymerase specialized sigma24 family protein
MSSENLNQHLSQIQTLWTVVRKAHGDAASAEVAQSQLLKRYGGAVRRYLLGALRDPDGADELFQEFALRLVKGSLGGADPERGRFRNFVKGVLFHLVADHHKGRQRRPQALTPDHPEPAVEPPTLADLDRDFVKSWRDDLLARCWAALAETERKGGKPYCTVLRFRADHADMPSQRMAEELSTQLGRPLTAAGVRQILHRAREKFADLILDEVIQSLEDPTAAQVEEELMELGLMVYCQPALQRRG